MKYLVYAVGAAIIAVNLFFTILGIKTFSKKTHSILVLCLSISDGLHGIAALLLADSVFGSPTTTESANISKSLCIVKLVLYFVSIGISLTVLLFISIERYITVKHYNFTPTGLTLKMRYIIIGSLIALVWAYICVWIVSAPVKKANVKVCSIGALYNENVLNVNCWAIICMYASLIFANLFLYGKTTTIIRSVFRKPMILSEKRVDFEMNNAPESPQPSTSKDPMHVPSIAPSRKRSLWGIARNQLTRGNTHSRTYFNAKRSQYSTNMRIKFATNVSRELDKSSSSNEIHRRKISAIFSPWERRAVVTNCYLIADHVIFFLPMICFFVVDRLGGDMPKEALIYGLLWLMLHFLINPFIFAWRIKEIHSEINRLFRCRRKIMPML